MRRHSPKSAFNRAYKIKVSGDQEITSNITLPIVKPISRLNDIKFLLTVSIKVKEIGDEKTDVHQEQALHFVNILVFLSCPFD